MKLLRLTINNFLSFQHASIALDDKGLVGVSGQNKDETGATSNGSGKSSLFVAVRWCLYGVTGKGIDSDAVVNDKAVHNCSVENIWLDEVTGITYRITRYRRHKKYKNNLRFEVKHPGLDWKDETLGKNTLTQELVNEALGMDDLVFCASCYAAQSDSIDIPKMTDSELKELLENSLPFAKIEPLFVKFKDRLTKAKAALESWERLFQHNEVSMNANEQLLIGTNNDAKKFEDERDSKLFRLDEQIEILENSIEDLHDKIIDTSKLEDAIKVVRSKLVRYETLDYSINQATFELKSIKTNLEAYEDKVTLAKAAFVKSDACPACDQEMPKDKKEEFLANLEAKRKKLSEMYNEAQNRLKTYNAQLPDYLDLREKLGIFLEKLQSNEIVKEQIKKKQEAIGSFQREKETLKYNPYVKNIKGLEESIEDFMKKSDGYLKQIEDAKPEIIVLEKLVETLGPKGFRYHLLETATPELNNRTNYYLSLLTDGAIGAIWSTVEKISTGEYREKFSIKVSMNGRTSFGALSGGQQRKVRLACWFALQDLIAARAEKDVHIWFGDEIDTALDDAGLERLMSLLEEKARQKGTVLVISHHSLADWIANGITVTMKDDISTVDGFLNVSD